MDSVAQEIFNIIKGANYDVVLFTDAGEKTLDSSPLYVDPHRWRTLCVPIWGQDKIVFIIGFVA